MDEINMLKADVREYQQKLDASQEEKAKFDDLVSEMEARMGELESTLTSLRFENNHFGSILKEQRTIRRAFVEMQKDNYQFSPYERDELEAVNTEIMEATHLLEQHSRIFAMRVMEFETTLSEQHLTEDAIQRAKTLFVEEVDLLEEEKGEIEKKLKALREEALHHLASNNVNDQFILSTYKEPPKPKPPMGAIWEAYLRRGGGIPEVPKVYSSSQLHLVIDDVYKFRLEQLDDYEFVTREREKGLHPGRVLENALYERLLEIYGKDTVVNYIAHGVLSAVDEQAASDNRVLLFKLALQSSNQMGWRYLYRIRELLGRMSDRLGSNEEILEFLQVLYFDKNKEDAERMLKNYDLFRDEANPIHSFLNFIASLIVNDEEPRMAKMKNFFMWEDGKRREHLSHEEYVLLMKSIVPDADPLALRHDYDQAMWIVVEEKRRDDYNGPVTYHLANAAACLELEVMIGKDIEDLRNLPLAGQF
uniref:Uncharacterized protein n=1 Tax=Palpitomonas bilix TaxID=652834 RepID=A0A7S3D2U5_9EUKA